MFLLADSASVSFKVRWTSAPPKDIWQAASKRLRDSLIASDMVPFTYDFHDSRECSIVVGSQDTITEVDRKLT
jgi:hypothetical protein